MLYNRYITNGLYIYIHIHIYIICVYIIYSYGSYNIRCYELFYPLKIVCASQYTRNVITHFFRATVESDCITVS